MQIHVLARLLIYSNRKVLLAKTQHSSGEEFCFLPGGHVEYNESVKQAARRELWEELGIEEERICHLRLVGMHEQSFEQKGKPYHEIAFVLTGNIQGLTAGTAVDSREEHLSFEWHQLDSLNKINMLPVDYRRLIPQWLNHPVEEERFFVSHFPTDRASGGERGK